MEIEKLETLDNSSLNYTKSGIYVIYNKVTNDFYIGYSKKLNNRKVEHRCYLSKNKHPNKHLQSAYNKYGEHSFKFKLLEVVEDLNLKQKLIEREFFWISLLKPTYNKCIVYKNKISRDNLLKMREKRKYAPLSTDTKNKISNTLKGSKLSNQHKNNIKSGLQKFYSKKLVDIYDINENYIETMGCVAEISRKYNVHKSCIFQNLRKKSKRAGSYIFVYKETNS